MDMNQTFCLVLIAVISLCYQFTAAGHRNSSASARRLLSANPCADSTKGITYIEGVIHGCSGAFSGGVAGASAKAVCGSAWHVCTDETEAFNLGLTYSLCKDTAASSKFFATGARSTGSHACGLTGDNDVYGCGANLDFLDTLTEGQCGKLWLGTGIFPGSPTTTWDCSACTGATERLNIELKTDGTDGGILCCVAPCADDTIGVVYVAGAVHGCSGTFSGGMLGAGAAAVCGTGWHVCDSQAQLLQYGMTGSICSNTDAGDKFFATALHSAGSRICEATGDNDVFGCSSKVNTSPLEFLIATTGCDPITRGTDAFTVATGWTCTGCDSSPTSELTLISNVLASAGGVLCCADAILPSSGPTAAPSTYPSTAGPSASPSTAGPSKSPSSSSPSTYPSTAGPSTYPSTSGPSASPSTYPSTGSPSTYPSTAGPSETPTTYPSTSTPTISLGPTDTPSRAPSMTPSEAPTASPTHVPSSAPSSMPSSVPSSSPTSSPSSIPSGIPSLQPTFGPSTSPSAVPSQIPSVQPTFGPSTSPTTVPSGIPSLLPTFGPSSSPSVVPSGIPSVPPTFGPSTSPSKVPSASPSSAPSKAPSNAPSAVPSNAPSSSPTAIPSVSPSTSPSSAPTGAPSQVPSLLPSNAPSAIPSNAPTLAPSLLPTDAPSHVPSVLPTDAPSQIPSNAPSDVPTLSPSSAPSSIPSAAPSLIPSDAPSSVPSDTPSNVPSDVPSDAPSLAPTVPPTRSPSSNPSQSPSDTPSDTPTKSPSMTPTTSSPSSAPSAVPSSSPSVIPSAVPTVFPTRAPAQALVPLDQCTFDPQSNTLNYNHDFSFTLSPACEPGRYFTTRVATVSEVGPNSASNSVDLSKWTTTWTTQTNVAYLGTSVNVTSASVNVSVASTWVLIQYSVRTFSTAVTAVKLCQTCSTTDIAKDSTKWNIIVRNWPFVHSNNQLKIDFEFSGSSAVDMTPTETTQNGVHKLTIGNIATQVSPNKFDRIDLSSGSATSSGSVSVSSTPLTGSQQTGQKFTLTYLYDNFDGFGLRYDPLLAVNRIQQTSTATNPSGGRPISPQGVAILVVVGILLGVCLIGGTIFYFWRQKNMKEGEGESAREDDVERYMSNSVDAEGFLPPSSQTEGLPPATGLPPAPVVGLPPPVPRGAGLPPPSRGLPSPVGEEDGGAVEMADMASDDVNYFDEPDAAAPVDAGDVVMEVPASQRDDARNGHEPITNLPQHFESNEVDEDMATFYEE